MTVAWIPPQRQIASALVRGTKHSLTGVSTRVVTKPAPPGMVPSGAPSAGSADLVRWARWSGPLGPLVWSAGSAAGLVRWVRWSAGSADLVRSAGLVRWVAGLVHWVRWSGPLRPLVWSAGSTGFAGRLAGSAGPLGCRLHPKRPQLVAAENPKH
eukprot:1936274-Amphidinium_carterae.1